MFIIIPSSPYLSWHCKFWEMTDKSDKSHVGHFLVSTFHVPDLQCLANLHSRVQSVAGGGGGTRTSTCSKQGLTWDRAQGLQRAGHRAHRVQASCGSEHKAYRGQGIGLMGYRNSQDTGLTGQRTHRSQESQETGHGEHRGCISQDTGLTGLTGTEGTWIRGDRTHRGIWLLLPVF